MLEVKNKQDIIMSRKNKDDFKHATNCYICGDHFTPKNYKVRDHCHRIRF